jgi:hypothetical protein
MSKLNLFAMFNKNNPQGAIPSGGSPISGNSSFGQASFRVNPENNASDSNPGKAPAQVLAEGMVNVRDIIAPAAIEIDFSTVRVGTMFYRTLFVSGYPRFVGANWLSPLINFDHSLDISMFYYPVKSKVILDDLRRKITELEATVMSTREKGRISDPVVNAALEDANSLQEQLVKGVEKYFQFSFYITIPAETMDELNNVTSKLESTLGSLLLISKVASLQMEEALQSTIPAGMDKLLITRNMDTTSLATTFPFTSSDLTQEDGIMYGINKHNGSLVIFERFSLENANSVVFAKSGSGKSYFVKLEALRHIVFGAEVLVIDPEEEYKDLCQVVGGNYIDFSSNSPSKINPFDLSAVVVEGENELSQKLISLITLLKLMLGGLTPTEEAILDRALIETYRIKGITTDPQSQSTREPPVMEDLYKVLIGSDEPEARGMAERLEKFIKGSMTGIFDSQSNINLTSKMTVFSTKHLEEALRPIAFYIILDFIWTTIRRDLRKRILVVEEAWYLMQNEDSARFIYGIAKRARKYYLGLTTISQDVDDFLTSEYGKAIVTNSSIQVLLKQHPAAIEKVAETFYLSEGEKRLLLAADVGEGLFFAGANHVAIKIVASEAENKLITTNPEEILKAKQERASQQSMNLRKETPRPVYKQFTPQNVKTGYTTMDASGNPTPEIQNILEKNIADASQAKINANQNQIPSPIQTPPTTATSTELPPVQSIPTEPKPRKPEDGDSQPSTEEIMNAVLQEMSQAKSSSQPSMPVGVPTPTPTQNSASNAPSSVGPSTLQTSPRPTITPPPVTPPAPRPSPLAEQLPEIKVQFANNNPIPRPVPPAQTASQAPRTPSNGSFAPPTRNVPEAQGPLNGAPLKPTSLEDRNQLN